MRNLLAACVFVSLVSAPLAADEVGLYDYVLAEPGGKETTLAAYRGRILVLEFFATWCPPCRKDLPDIASLQERYPVDRVAIVAVSADGPSNTLRKLPAFLEETGLRIPALVGGDLFIDRYVGLERSGGRQLVLPQTYVFGGQGELLMRFVGEKKSKKRSLAEELDRLLKGGAS